MTTTGITDAQLLFMAKSVLCELNFLTKRLKHKKLLVTSLKLIKTSTGGAERSCGVIYFILIEKSFFVNKISLVANGFSRSWQKVATWLNTESFECHTEKNFFRNALFVREKNHFPKFSFKIRRLPACRANSSCWEVNTCGDSLWNLLFTVFRIKLKHNFQQTVDINLIKYQIT